MTTVETSSGDCFKIFPSMALPSSSSNCKIQLKLEIFSITWNFDEVKNLLACASVGNEPRGRGIIGQIHIKWYFTNFLYGTFYTLRPGFNFITLNVYQNLTLTRFWSRAPKFCPILMNVPDIPLHRAHQQLGRYNFIQEINKTRQRSYLGHRTNVF